MYGSGVDNVRIDGLMPQQFFQILSKAALEGLNVGDLIQGRVTAMENGLLLITLLDGSSFSASIPEGLDVPPGTMLTLQIGEPAGDQVTARIVRMDTPSKQENESGGQVSQVTRQLQSLGVKATDDLISRVLDLLKENPGLGLKNAAFLAANRMDSDQAMLEMAVKLANREYDINDNLQALSRMLTDSLSQADRAGQESVLKPLLFERYAEQIVRDLSERIIGSPGEGRVPSQEDILFLAGKLTDALKGFITGNEPLDREQVYDAVRDMLSALSPARDTTPGNTDTGRGPLPGGLNIEDGQLDEILKGFAGDILKTVERTGEYFEKESADIKKIIGEIFEKAYVRVEDGRAADIDLREKAEALKKVISLASDTAKLADGKGSQAIQPVVRELSNALSFFSQVSTYHVFMHVPLIINRHETAGQLYIMKRKSKRGRIDPNQFTLFMSLKTQNLGLVETFLNATYKYVTIHFRVENDHLAEFVKAQRKDLYEALEKKGYRLAEMRCRVFGDEPVNPLDAGEVTESILGMNTRLDLRI